MGSSRGALVVAVDVGLTLLKAAAFDAAGKAAARAEVAAPARRPGPVRPGYCEAMWRGVTDAVAAVATASAERGSVRAVVLSTAGVSGIVMPPGGRPMGLPRPGKDSLRAVSADPGWQPFGPQAFSTASILAAQLEEYVLARTTGPRPRVGSLHTYLTWRLSGRWVADAASGPGQLSWPAPLLRHLGRVALPELLACEAVVGPVRAPVAARLGLAPDVAVVMGGHDGVCASFGAGAYREGDCCLTLSTNFVPRPVSGRRIGAGYAYPIRPGAWAWSREVPGAGRALDAVAVALAPALPLGRDRHLHLSALAAASGRAPPADRSLLAAAPAEVQGWARTRLHAGDSPGAVYAAMAEAAVDALVDTLAEARASGYAPQRYVASGGFSQNRFVVDRISDRLGAPLAVAAPDAGLRGAAAFAAAAIHLFDSPEAALEAYTRAERAVAPPRQGAAAMEGA